MIDRMSKLKFEKDDLGFDVCTNLKEVFQEIEEEKPIAVETPKKLEFEGYVVCDNEGINNPIAIAIFKYELKSVLNLKKYKVTLEELPND